MTDIKRQNTVYCVLPELNDVLMFALRILKESGTYCTKYLLEIHKSNRTTNLSIHSQWQQWRLMSHLWN